MRVLSGIQPSGGLHIGNYFAMMHAMIHYQKEHDLFCFIVNYHALTTVTNATKLRKETQKACLDFLALGLNPHKSTFFIQGDVPEVCELTWILNNHISVGLLERAHSYKDKLAKGLTPHNGLLSYPVLMAADILLYQAHVVPIGKDQKQHLEITRNIANKFNYIYGDTFVIPEPRINEDTATIPGIDGQKMSKSYGNTLKIFADEKILQKRIMSIVTDSIPVNKSKDPDKCNVYAIISLFMNRKEREELASHYRTGGVSYAQVKKELFARMWEYFRPYREKRKQLASDPTYISETMKNGAIKARAVGSVTLAKVRHLIGLDY